MEFMKCTVFIYISCVVPIVLGGCELDRNEINKYPFVLKLVVDDVMRCHGVLITPRCFVAPYEPVKDVKNLSELTVFGQRNGDPYCYDTRQPKYLRRISLAGMRTSNYVVGAFEIGFDVTLNNPYLYANMEDFDGVLMREKFKDTKEFDCCTIPVFSNKTSSARIVEESVIYVGNAGATADFWANVFCNGSQNAEKCQNLTKSQYLFVYNPVDHSNDFSWYQGAVLICNGTPLAAILSMQITE